MVNAEPMNLHTAYISVGSNLGPKLENCRTGVAALTRSDHIRLVAESPIYRTEPVDYLDQDWFINYAVKIETDLDPLRLLDTIDSVEQGAGRVRKGVRFGPRILDLDIILYDDMVMDHERLTIPHPRMHKRRFVLKPIYDIDPDINHPLLKQTIGFLLKNLPESEQRIIEYR